MKYWIGEVKFWKKLAFMSSEDRHRVALELEIRGNIEPVSWGVCAMEINAHTVIGKRMLKDLRTKGLL